MISGLISVYTLLVVFNLKKDLILTALPKSLTTPIAMQDEWNESGGILH